MEIVRIDNEQWVSGLETVSNAYGLIGPVKDKAGYTFQCLDKGELPELHFDNTTLSSKKFLFPQSEKILEYSSDVSNVNYANMRVIDRVYPAKAIIGVRPCDARANLILKMNFDTPENKDPYWLKAYNAMTFIGLACDDPCSECFCTTAGSSPYGIEGLDIILASQESNKSQYLAKVITEKGGKFLDKAGWKTLSKEQPSIFDERKTSAEAKISSRISTDKLENIEILDLYPASFWSDISFACLNCGTCTFVCPTCWCFDIQDEVHQKSGIRMKNWDSCMFPIFTVHTTGHNPRGTKKQRVRQRFMHKLKYFVDKHNCGPMCVGCGRCIRSCPVNIDIRKVCELMNGFKPEEACSVRDK